MFLMSNQIIQILELATSTNNETGLGLGSTILEDLVIILVNLISLLFDKTHELVNFSFLHEVTLTAQSS